MDNKKKVKKSPWENPGSPSYGYSIEFGDTTYKNTLDERIQAAKNASSIAKQTQKQKYSGKLILKNNANKDLEKNANYQSMCTKTTKNGNQDLKNKNRQYQSSSFKSVIETATNVQSKSSANNTLPTFKGGGQMQRRLEAIKARKMEAMSLKCEENTLESTKFSNSPLSPQIVQSNNCVPNLFDINVSKRIDYKLRSSVQKYTCNEIGQCSLTKNNAGTSNYGVTSVQNRLIKAKEELKAKSKFRNQTNVSDVKINKEPSCALVSDHQDTTALVHNNKNKIKRLSQSNHIIKKKIPTIISAAKKLKSNIPEIDKMVNKQLVTVQQKPVLLKCIVPSSPTIITEVASPDIFKKSKQKELNTFGSVTPKTVSAQQRIENIKEKTQCIENDSMEWEVISEPNVIVNKVNDLRKTTCEYEPMEWIPDSILQYDHIDHCLVVDTNVYLSDLNTITIILDKYIPEYGYITIVIPWQVLQELDCLKKNENALGYQAREVTRWLLHKLSIGHPRLKGEPMVEKNGLNPDDAILKCAISLKDKVNHIYLVTNDKILMVKSKVNEICSKDSEWLRSIATDKNQSESNIFQGNICT